MLLLIAVGIIVLPALTYYLTTAFFFQSAKNDAAGKRPPTIPYLVPGVFHTFSIAAEGPQKFFARLFKEFGSFAPFTVKAGLQTFVVLRDPKHIKVVIEASKPSEQGSIVRHEYEGIFKVPKRQASIPAEFSDPAKYNEKVYNAFTTPIRKHLTGESMVNIGERYASKLSSNMDDKMFQVGTWTQIEDFWSFFHQVLTRCLVETLFGPTIFRLYPKFVKDYWTFEQALESYVPGMTWLLGANAYEQPRDALLEGIEKWLRANQSGSNTADVSTINTNWDDHRGSPFIQELTGLLSEFTSQESRAVELLKIIHCANGKLVPSTIWSLIEVLRNPQLANQMNDIVSKNPSQMLGTYGVTEIAASPLVKSLYHETSRLRMAQYMIYPAKAHDILLDREYVLPKGRSPIVFSHDVALDNKSWAKARPRTVERPLEEFWGGRFLIPDKPKKRGGFESGEFSLEDLDLLAPAFGGHQNVGLGSEYAQTIHAATLTVLLNEWEIQLCDPEFTDAVMPTMSDKAFGTVIPLRPVAVRIRKRRPNRTM
ncbi:hypothetical protein COCVIDRAFT_11346 [Bipolaris victoriae FI3]|uniref:Cytochrome P450 n=1 Tax=Bipolaris victoriae (strain FI3) TaxID=930091 RepID=W7EXQ1_BIPV3|nr:hypothetical protein COCVIDRAFT_11346 [Bipolaris victoriae FI3]